MSTLYLGEVSPEIYQFYLDHFLDREGEIYSLWDDYTTLKSNTEKLPTLDSDLEERIRKVKEKIFHWLSNDRFLADTTKNREIQQFVTKEKNTLAGRLRLVSASTDQKKWRDFVKNRKAEITEDQSKNSKNKNDSLSIDIQNLITKEFKQREKNGDFQLTIDGDETLSSQFDIDLLFSKKNVSPHCSKEGHIVKKGEYE